MFNKIWKVVISIIITTFISIIIGTPIVMYVYAGITGTGSTYLTAFMLATVADENVRDVFWDKASMEKAALKRPSICVLADRLYFEGDITTEEELVAAIRERCPK